MSFNYASLITDRTQTDVDALKALVKKPMSQWTVAEAEAFTAATLKGSYDYTDLNRVSACMEDLVARLNGLGYQVPGYERVKIERTAKPSSRLPEGYTEVQYIQSSGTQWVDTEVKPNQDTRVVVDAIFPAQSSAVWLLGARNGNTDRTYGFLTYDNIYRSDYNNKTTEETITNIPTGRFTVDKNKNVTRLNGTVVRTAEEGTFQCSHNLYLFANNNNGTAGGHSKTILYSAKIYDDGVLVRDFVPCIDPSGEVGLYDTATKAFFANEGTGVFFSGPRKVTLPEGYTQVEYIQSNGSQYVDSLFTPNQDTRIFYDCERLSASSAEHFFGVRTGNSPVNAFCFYIYNSGWRSAYNNKVTNGDAPGVGRYSIDMNKNVTTINQTLTITGTYGSFTSTGTALLFAMRSAPNGVGYGSHKLYWCQIFDNGTLTRDYVPSKNAAGTAGLYDLVNNQFYGNAGTGSFTAGAEVTWPEDDASESDVLDPYLWYAEDSPTQPQIEQYRGNVAAVRAVLAMPDTVPEAPETLRKPHTYDANNIEAILIAIDQILTHIPAARRHCGVTVCGLKGVIA